MQSKFANGILRLSLKCFGALRPNVREKWKMLNPLESSIF